MSNNKNLGIIYEEVYENLKTSSSNVFKNERGRLYGIISEILGESKPQSRQETTKIICRRLNINPTSYLKDDFQIVEQLLSEVFTERHVTSRIIPSQVKNLANKVFVEFNNHLNFNEEESMKWLVVAACMLVGVLACLHYINHRKEQNHAREINQPSSVRELEHQVEEYYSAELCLVVPASEVSDLKPVSLLDGGRLKDLVDLASYFLCTTKENAPVIEKGLPLTDEAIPPDSPRGVYVRVTIKSVNNMINKTTQFEIKENIEDSKKYQIIKLNWLRGLSGLESFIR